MERDFGCLVPRGEQHSGLREIHNSLKHLICAKHSSFSPFTEAPRGVEIYLFLCALAYPPLGVFSSKCR